MASPNFPLLPRHIQDHNAPNSTLQHHWAYAARVLPCTKDRGTCEYLDSVYAMHDTSMLYTFILWGVLLGIAVVIVWARGRRMDDASHAKGSATAMRRARNWGLKDAPAKWVFGRVSRLQVFTLTILLAYLFIFSLVGITYKTWLTPIKASSLHNTRTGLGGASDRLGALAFALTPFTVLLSMRESLLSLLTGIPYQHFNFLHRWTGRIIFVQALLHTVFWIVVEGRLYQPQPTVGVEWIRQPYMVAGCVAMFLLLVMVVTSTRTAIEWFGYEVFKVGHWGLAVLYLGACWGHWDRLWCWLVASLVLVVADQVVRWLRVLAIHYREDKGRKLGFHCAQARVTLLGTTDDLVVRLDFDYEHAAWMAGQHFQLTFPSLSLWQSHPFTPASSPEVGSRIQHHTYLLRVRKGITAKLAALGDGASVPVILCGGYGRAFPSYATQNILAVAGGTGVTFSLPVILAALEQQTAPRFALDLVWVVRKTRDLLWLAPELVALKRRLGEEASNLRVQIFVTREDSPEITTVSEKSSEAEGNGAAFSVHALLQPAHNFTLTYLDGRHPNVDVMVQDFVDRADCVGGTTKVLGSGPEGMGSDLRGAVAGRGDVVDLRMYWDSRG
ncbi:hypothetical protein LTR62_001706 [Meristemomyces frigidus]|uniref:FAD-binding FR-type domain-containing protein n=1 Tax=Meristemomyces frigidus TaxID=1508187 RepID=A0AAN7T900_9PEZI|nr:hypothetical protein LTR62_001706 [Meristemomyces frigidus]